MKRNQKRALALLCALLLCMAFLAAVSLTAMLVGAAVMLYAASVAVSDRRAEGEFANFAEQRARRRRVAHNVSSEFRQRWAASAGVAGKLGSGSSITAENGRLAARNDKNKIRVYNARDQTLVWGNSLFGMVLRRENRIRDRPMTAIAQS